MTGGHRMVRLLAGVAFALILCRAFLPAGLVRPPAAMIPPFADWLNAAFAFAQNDLGLMRLTRGFAAVLEVPLDILANLLHGKRRWPFLGPVPWSVVAFSGAVAGYALGGWRLAALTGGTFVWIALTGQWLWTMETLSVIAVAVPFAVGAGLALGLLAWRFARVEAVLNPVLNIAQSMPHFAYMIPVVVFIGVGAKAGAIVSIIFAVPPMIRMTVLGLRAVPAEMIEAARMSGASPRQVLLKVRLPAARRQILIGVNQVIMQCLAMVVLASFIGMPGLGQRLLQFLQALRFGPATEIGITIVLLAITLDVLSKAIAARGVVHRAGGWVARHRLALVWFGGCAVLWGLSRAFPLLEGIERRQALSIAAPVDATMRAVIGALAPVTAWLRWFLVTWLLIPMRDFYLWLPFAAVLLLAGAAGWAAGGRRTALVCLGYGGLIALSGWWDRAMITGYTVTVAMLAAALVGFPLGAWAAARSARARRVLLLCDTFQTFPGFIYLIPVIMLFGVSDVAVVAAVVSFAAVPIVRYTIEGLGAVPGETVEAAVMSGASPRQVFWRVRLPLAMPTLLVGANQAVMFSLFMVIIAAFIGTQDLGQEMQRALSTTNVGKGLVLGLVVAFMGLSVDALVTARRR